MKQASLAEAKAHLSKIVEDASRGVQTMIHRHGKPIAVVIPIADMPKKPRMSAVEFAALLAEGAKYDDPSYSAVQDTRAGRR